MGKNLYLLRHAKSDWSLPGQKDFERDLNTRGYNDAPRMGLIIADKGVSPDIIISSPSKRTTITAEFVAERLKYDINNIQFEDEIYEASPRTLFNLICGLNNKYNSVILIGHNPTFTYVAEYLTGAEIGNMPTCSIVNIYFDTDNWQEVSAKSGKLEWFEYPKKYQEEE
jgi:phosphohistidine phosphatase